MRRPPIEETWLPKVRDRLGKVSAAKLAKEVGVSESVMHRARRRLGIKSTRDTPDAPMRYPPFGEVPPAPWTSWLEYLVATMTGREARAAAKRELAELRAGCAKA